MKKVGDKGAIFSDIHIGENRDSVEFYELSKKWVEYFVGEITKRNVKDVYFLGDWHHCRDEISVQTLDVSAEIMNLFPKDVTIHMITGNHDCYFKNNSDIHSLQFFKNWENVNVYDEVTVLETANGKKLAMIPWGCENEIVSSDYTFGHFEINNFKMNNYRVCDHGIDSKDLIKGGNRVYTGHFHCRQTKKYKAGEITYVGSPIQHNFNDVGNENGFYLIDFVSGEEEFVKNPDSFPVFRYIKASELKTKNTPEIEGDFVKLFIDKELKESQIEKLKGSLASKNPNRLLIEDLNVKKDIDISKIDDKLNEFDIGESISEFIKLMDEPELSEKIKEKALYYYEKNK